MGATGVTLFYIQEAMNHTDDKIARCGLFVDKNKPYMAASPDGMFSCKCREGYVIEIKCPCKFKDQFIKERINDCDFLEILDGKIHLKKSHKYYTQVVSQMAVTGTRFAYFIVWILKDMYFEIIQFSKEQCFLKVTYASSFLVSEKIMFVGIVNVLLNQEEVNENEEEQHNSVQCDDVVYGTIFGVKI